MTAQIIILPTEAVVDDAWKALEALNQQILDNPRVLLDRDFYQRHATAEARFKQLYLQWAGK